MRNTAFAVFGLMLCLLTGCIDENPALVNPPSQKEYVKMRFINLSSDLESRTLNLDGSDWLTAAYGVSSEAKNPPSDSVIAVVKKGTSSEFQYPKKIKFVRSTYTTCLSLPSPKNSSRKSATDTLVYFSSSSGLGTGTAYAYLKFINAFPDTSCTFSLIEGCPNGTPWVSSAAYRSVSSQVQVIAGHVPMSLVKSTSSGRQVIGLYDVTLANDVQYSAIVNADPEGSPVFNFLTEHEDSPSALARPQQISDNTAGVRTLNFSSKTVSIKKSGDIVAEDVAPGAATAYKTVSACTSQYSDTLSAYYSGFSPTSSTLSLDVYGKYTYIIADSATKLAGTGLILPQAKVTYLYNDRALIRVVNLIEGAGGIYLTTGAHTDSSSDGYVSGETIASKITFGGVSGIYPLYLGAESRNIPLVLTGAASPTRIMLSSFAEMAPGKSYIIVLGGTSSDPKLYCIAEDQENFTLNPEKSGEFFQFVNYLTGAGSVSVAYNNTIANAEINYSRGFASVAELGEASMRVASSNVSWTADHSGSTLIVAAGGDASSPRFINLKSSIPDGKMSFSRRRFCNAAADVSSLTVHLDKKDGDITASDVAYGSVSDYVDDSAQRSYSLFFYDSSTGKLIYRMDDIQVIHGKIYTFVFGGNASKGYSVNIIQEY